MEGCFSSLDFGFGQQVFVDDVNLTACIEQTDFGFRLKMVNFLLIYIEKMRLARCS